MPPPFTLPATTNRIHIIGGAGSGKTTLAGWLAAHMGTRAYDLDEVGYEGGAGPKRPLGLRLANVRWIISQSHWVTEGVYLWWVDALLAQADLIIWLDLPWHVAAWRMLNRHLILSLTGRNRHKGVLKLLGFLRWTRHYYTTPVWVSPIAPDDDGALSRVATAYYLRPYAYKLIHCRTAQDVAIFRRVWRRNVPKTK